MNRAPDSKPGTYALVLALAEPGALDVGRLGRIQFDSPFYLYLGSALGPGGLAARIRHHLQAVQDVHWHIDYLRQTAKVVTVWYSTDNERHECAWAQAAASLAGASPVPRFGASDCRCPSHLVAFAKLPPLPAFRRKVIEAQPECGSIARVQAVHYITA